MQQSLREQLRNLQLLRTLPLSSTTMNVSTVLLYLLLMVFSPQVLAEPASVPTTCCFTVASKRLLPQQLESYRRTTSSKCSQKAIIFKTKRGKLVCADPKQKWVQASMKILDQKLQLRSQK
ncbi:eotaxin-like [Perognathus longimembris pacificus]|uniref:eotaxin-like n=1 Tax=Perognathus longimembris pacificus TaxID=214514 RepID=UPI002019D3E8|nr:eotaxin-like [Perognathus longimembris pacificus]